MLKRSPFRSKLPPPRPARQYLGSKPDSPRPQALRIDDGKARLVVPLKKREYVRSKKLMKAYRSIPCQNCGVSDGTVCGAHSNWAIHGKGRSIKADDNRCASLCHGCHAAVDSGSTLTEQQRQRVWWGAHVETIGRLLFDGSWPDGVPVPSFHEYPKEWA